MCIRDRDWAIRKPQNVKKQKNLKFFKMSKIDFYITLYQFCNFADCGLPNQDLRGLACGMKVMISEGKNQSAFGSDRGSACPNSLVILGVPSLIQPLQMVKTSQFCSGVVWTSLEARKWQFWVHWGPDRYAKLSCNIIKGSWVYQACSNHSKWSKPPNFVLEWFGPV